MIGKNSPHCQCIDILKMSQHKTFWQFLLPWKWRQSTFHQFYLILNVFFNLKMLLFRLRPFQQYIWFSSTTKVYISHFMDTSHPRPSFTKHFEEPIYQIYFIWFTFRDYNAADSLEPYYRPGGSWKDMFLSPGLQIQTHV